MLAFVDGASRGRVLSLLRGPFAVLLAEEAWALSARRRRRTAYAPLKDPLRAPPAHARLASRAGAGRDARPGRSAARLDFCRKRRSSGGRDGADLSRRGNPVRGRSPSPPARAGKAGAGADRPPETTRQRGKTSNVESSHVPASVPSVVPDLTDGFLALGLALVVSLLATPVAKVIAWRIGAIDMPRERGLHQFPTPRLGGLAILAAVIAAGLVFLPRAGETDAILIGATVIALVGAADDLLELSADFKLVGQILAAVIPVASGVRGANPTLPFIGPIHLGQPLSYGLTVLGIVALMNVLNFIDGVDGLAAGVCTIGAATFAAIALSLDRNAAGVLALIVVGATLGYLRHGFAPASIFLGDTGSNLLGYLL